MIDGMFRAALVAVSFASIGPAYAGRGGGTVADTRLAKFRRGCPIAGLEYSAGRSGTEHFGVALQRGVAISAYREVPRPVNTRHAGVDSGGYLR